MTSCVLSPRLLVVWLSIAALGCWGSAELVGGFRTHMSSADVEGLLEAGGYEWEVIEKGGLPPGDQRPSYSGEKWRASHFKDRGFEGRVEVEFFNERLMAVSFFPDEFDSYLKSLDPEAKAQIGERLRLSWDPRVNVRVGSSPEGLRCVTWESVRLREEDRRWIADHG